MPQSRYDNYCNIMDRANKYPKEIEPEMKNIKQLKQWIIQFYQ